MEGIAKLIIHKVLEAEIMAMSLAEYIPKKKRASEPLIPISTIGMPGMLNKKT